MSNKEFIEMIQVTHGIDKKSMSFVCRLLKLNINFQDTIKLLMRIGINESLMWQYLFTMSMYCDYSYKVLLEFNKLAEDYYKFFGKSGLTQFLYDGIKNENSSDYTLYYNIRVGRVVVMVNRLYLGDTTYDLELGEIRKKDGTSRYMGNIGFIWIEYDKSGNVVWEIYEDNEIDDRRAFFKKCYEVIDSYFKSGRDFIFLVPTFRYNYNKKIEKLSEQYLFEG